MKNNFAQALQVVLKSEGGFVNHPKDPGGMTNLGCTKAVWEEWIGHPVSEKNMRDLQPADVAPLYKRKYWDKVCGDDLPSGLDYALFDAAINSGPGRASKWLQEALGVKVDGSLGPVSLAAVQASDKQKLLAKFNDIRLQFLEALPTWDTFGKGWGRRVSEVQSSASKMIA